MNRYNIPGVELEFADHADNDGPRSMRALLAEMPPHIRQRFVAKRKPPVIPSLTPEERQAIQAATKPAEPAISIEEQEERSEARALAESILQPEIDADNAARRAEVRELLLTI